MKAENPVKRNRQKTTRLNYKCEKTTWLKSLPSTCSKNSTRAT